MSAVHDGGEGARSGVPADSSHVGGIAVHAVKEVGAQQGWGCTQMLSEQAPEAESAQEAAPLLQDSQQSACAPAQDHLQHPVDLIEHAEEMMQHHRASCQAESQTDSQNLPPDAIGSDQAGQEHAARAAEAPDQASMPSGPPAEAPEVRVLIINMHSLCACALEVQMYCAHFTLCCGPDALHSSKPLLVWTNLQQVCCVLPLRHLRQGERQPASLSLP